jgi:hypothetical protein
LVASNWLKVKKPAAPAVPRERGMGRVTLALRRVAPDDYDVIQDGESSGASTA